MTAFDMAWDFVKHQCGTKDEKKAKGKFEKMKGVDFTLPRGEMKVLQAEDKDYKRGVLVELLKDGGYEVAYWYDKFEVYPVEVIVDGKSIKKDARKVILKFHPKLEEARGKSKALVREAKRKYKESKKDDD
tara:strand:- start:989 stop:1381 length:393 start_codon:yes stop_codon:yes gene_type:complete